MTNSSNGKSFSPYTVIRALKRRWWYVALPLALLVPAAAIYTARLPQRFRARALVGEATAQTQLRFGDRNDAAAVTNAQDQLRTVRETLLTQPVLESVISQFRLYPVSRRRPFAEAARRQEGGDSDSGGYSRHLLYRI